MLTSQPDLTELSIFTYDEMETQTLQYVFKYCKKLRIFSFASPVGLSNDVFDSDLTPLLLEKVNFSYCKDINDKVLLNLAKRSHNLKSFSMDQCNEVTSQGIMYLTQFCPNLHDLVVEYYDYSDHLGSEGIGHIWKGCRKLQKFKYRQAFTITDNDMISFAQSCAQLKELTLHHCPLISDSTLVEITRSCKSISVVELWHSEAITLFGVLILILECIQLKKLILEGSSSVLDISGLGTEPDVDDISWESSVIRSTRKRIKEIVENRTIQRFSHLTHLVIESEECNAKFETVLSIAKLCPDIRQLSIPRFFFGGLGNGCFKLLKSICTVLVSVSLEGRYIEV